jgi:hypothetical protein
MGADAYGRPSCVSVWEAGGEVEREVIRISRLIMRRGDREAEICVDVLLCGCCAELCRW